MFCADENGNKNNIYQKYGYKDVYDYFEGKSIFNNSVIGWSGHMKNGSTFDSAEGTQNNISVAKATLEVQMSVRLSVCHQNPKTALNHSIHLTTTFTINHTIIHTITHNITTQHHNTNITHNITTQLHTSTYTTSHTSSNTTSQPSSSSPSISSFT